MQDVDPLFLALSRFRRRRFEECIQGCNRGIRENGSDIALICLKTAAMTSMAYEVDPQDEAEAPLDEETIANIPRPGTSLKSQVSLGQSRPQTSSLLDSFGQRPNTSQARPKTVLGRELRLVTASVAQIDDAECSFNMSRLNFQKIAQSPFLSLCIAEHLFYFLVDSKRAIELAVECSAASNHTDWFWKEFLGRAYCKLGEIMNLRANISEY